MSRTFFSLVALVTLLLCALSVTAQEEDFGPRHTLYDMPPRQLVNLPTAGTLIRGHFNLALRLYASGGAQGYTDIGLSNRFMIGISYGGTEIISNMDPDWNHRIGFNLKFRVVDELEYFPGIAVGYSDQGYGAWVEDWDRYLFKSRGFFAVASRSFYFYKWTAGWHLGANYSREYEVDDDKDLNIFGGFDATFNYNLALLFEYDAALNDDSGESDEITGQGRGYLSMSVKWLFAENLELEFLMSDLLSNRRGDGVRFARGFRMMYIDSF